MQSATVTGSNESMATPSAALRAALRQPIELLLGCGLAAAFGFAYWDTFAALANRWNQDANYGHGYLVPIVSIYLALQLRTTEPPELRGGTLLGTIVILLGMALRCGCLIVASLVGECLSMLLVLLGLALIVVGRRGIARLLAPIGFLIFMVPWPSALYSAVAFPLQLLVSQIAAMTLQILGIPVLHEGNMIHLPTQTMHVAEACSGLRQLTAFLAISTCAAILMRRPAWYRAILLLAAVPIAVAVNAIRVTATGLILHYGDAAWAEGWFHTAEGLLTVGLGLLLLMMLVSLLDWLMVDSQKPAPAARTESMHGLPQAA